MEVSVLLVAWLVGIWYIFIQPLYPLLTGMNDQIIQNSRHKFVGMAILELAGLVPSVDLVLYHYNPGTGIFCCEYWRTCQASILLLQLWLSYVMYLGVQNGG